MAKSGVKRRADGRPRGDASPRDEVLRKVSLVEDLYVRFCSTGTVCRLAQAHYGIPPRTTQGYLKQIRERWAAEENADRPLVKQMHRRALADRISKAEGASAWGAVFQGSRLLAEIDGVRSPEEHVHAVAVEEDLSKLSIKQLKALDEIRRSLDEEESPKGNGGDRG